MKKIICSTKKGQALVEYALVLALIGIVAILVVKALGSKSASSFDSVQSQMSAQGVTSTEPATAQ